MGTPNEDTWPGVSQLPEYNVYFTQRHFEVFPCEPLASLVVRLDESGIDLLSVIPIQKMLQMNPSQRITAADALNHPYLSDVPEAVKNMRVE